MFKRLLLSSVIFLSVVDPSSASGVCEDAITDFDIYKIKEERGFRGKYIGTWREGTMARRDMSDYIKQIVALELEDVVDVCGGEDKMQAIAKKMWQRKERELPIVDDYINLN